MMFSAEPYIFEKAPAKKIYIDLIRNVQSFSRYGLSIQFPIPHVPLPVFKFSTKPKMLKYTLSD